MLRRWRGLLNQTFFLGCACRNASDVRHRLTQNCLISSIFLLWPLVHFSQVESLPCNHQVSTAAASCHGLPLQVAVPYFEDLRVSVASLPPSVKHVPSMRSIKEHRRLTVWHNNLVERMEDVRHQPWGLRYTFFGTFHNVMSEVQLNLLCHLCGYRLQMIQVFSAGCGELHSAHWTHRSRRFLKPHFEHFQGMKRLT